MHVLVAMDSFKGSLSSLQAADAVAQGIRRACPDAFVRCIPIADGGEGTVDAVVEALNGRYVQTVVSDPLGKPVKARYGMANDTAVIEMAAASGLCLVAENERNPLVTSTRGTGELILHALDQGCRRFVIGIGGSATNDGGTGMARALGIRFLDEAGSDISEGGGALSDLARIDLSGLDRRITEASFRIACDVTNPLYGERGASRVFGPQKGATPEMVEQLDRNLEHYASIIRRDLNKDISNLIGAGAAGGLGGGLVAFLDAHLEGGIGLLLDAVDIDRDMRSAEYVITGEGRTDFQTAFGKAPAGIAARAKKYGIPVFILSGSLGEGFEEVYTCGVAAAYSIISRPMALQEAIEKASPLLTDAAERLIRTVQAASRA